jgi:hypothetical protein
MEQNTHWILLIKLFIKAARVLSFEILAQNTESVAHGMFCAGFHKHPLKTASDF